MQLTKERLKSLSKRAGEMDANGWEDDAETIRALIAAYNAGAQDSADDAFKVWKDDPRFYQWNTTDEHAALNFSAGWNAHAAAHPQPHQHSREEIAKFRITQRQHKVIDTFLSKADALIVSYTNVSGNHHGQLTSAIEMVRNARALLAKGE